MRDVPLDPNRCCEMVCGEGPWGAFRQHQCRRKWTVERDGKKYCTPHDPEKIKARNAARFTEQQAKYDARHKAFQADRRIHELHPKLLALAIKGYKLAQCAEDNGDDAITVGLSKQYQQAYEALKLTEQEKEQVQ